MSLSHHESMWFVFFAAVFSHDLKGRVVSHRSDKQLLHSAALPHIVVIAFMPAAPSVLAAWTEEEEHEAGEDGTRNVRRKVELACQLCERKAEDQT